MQVMECLSAVVSAGVGWLCCSGIVWEPFGETKSHASHGMLVCSCVCQSGLTVLFRHSVGTLRGNKITCKSWNACLQLCLPEWTDCSGIAWNPIRETKSHASHGMLVCSCHTRGLLSHLWIDPLPKEWNGYAQADLHLERKKLLTGNDSLNPPP